MSKGFIKLSASPWGAPVLFVKENVYDKQKRIDSGKQAIKVIDVKRVYSTNWFTMGCTAVICEKER